MGTLVKPVAALGTAVGEACCGAEEKGGSVGRARMIVIIYTGFFLFSQI